MSANLPFATLVITGAPPAEALARSLEALQALARAVAPAPTSSRRSGSREALVRAALVPDGLALHLGGVQLALALGLGASPAELAKRLLGLIAAAAAEDGEALAALLPDDAARRRAVGAARRLAPKLGEGWEAALQPTEGDLIALPPGLADRLPEAAPAPRGGVRMTVIGELAAVDFGGERLTLRVGPGGRALAGRYAPALEIKLLKLRRKLVHLTGEFALDEAGEPRAIRQALEVLPVDLAPVTWTVLETPAGAIAFDPPLVAVPQLDPVTGQRLVWEDPVLELSVAAESRHALIAAIEAEIDRRWALYAKTVRGAPEPVGARAWRRRVKPVSTADAYA